MVVTSQEDQFVGACCPRGAVFSAREGSFPSVRQLLQTITTYGLLYAVYIYVNNTIVLHKTVSESAAQYPSDHTSIANSRRQGKLDPLL